MPTYRFGKHPRKCDYRTLRFKNYVTAALPPPPSSLNVLDRVYAKLGTSDPTTLFPLDGNDSLGDCTIAALAHALTNRVETAPINSLQLAAGKPKNTAPPPVARTTGLLQRLRSEHGEEGRDESRFPCADSLHDCMRCDRVGRA